MFKDKLKVTFKSGVGGDGGIDYDKFRKPTGGIGGDGGNVYLEGTRSRYDLSYIKNNHYFEASDGERGGSNNRTGANGQDLIFKVPLKTNVYNEDGNLILSINEDGQRELFLKGGRGGLGNYSFKGKNYFEYHDKTTEGKPGEEKEVTLELELQSDIIFIGLPNAGKSSMIRELTNADAKVASYAFTTIDPMQGRLNGIILMDLPGLIEDTHEGKGVGTKFLKHTRSAKYIAHFISLESEDLVENYKIIRKELEAMDEGIADKPEIIVLTKADLIDPKDRTKRKESLEKYLKKSKIDIPIYIASMYDLDALEELKEVFVKLIKNPQ